MGPSGSITTMENAGERASYGRTSFDIGQE